MTTTTPLKFKRSLTSIIFALLFFNSVFIFGESADSLQKIIKNAKEDTIKVKALNRLALIQINDGNYQGALELANQAKTLGEKLSYQKGLAKALNSIGLIYYSKGNYPEALDYYLKSLKIAEKTNDISSLESSYNSLGNFYDTQGNYTEALNYYNLCLELRKQLNDKKLIAGCYTNIGTIYDTQGNFSQALYYYKMSLEISEELKDNEEIAIAYNNIGIVYQSKQLYTEAVNYFFKSAEIHEKTNNLKELAACYINIGDVHIAMKKFGLAQIYLKKGIDLSRQMGIKDYLMYGYLSFKNLDSLRGDFRSVFENYKNYILYRDSLINEESTKKTVEAKMNYDFDKKEAIAKAEQDKKDAIVQAEKNRQRLFLWLIAIAGLGVTIVAFVIYRSLQQNKKAKITIEMQKHKVEQHQKEILDSITYAKRLQDAILPPPPFVNKHLPENFILYKPKDIIAGDFYWMEHLNNVTLIASADSTGHGVPGAMVSLVCSNALNRAVNEFKLLDPGKILDKSRELVLETFSKSDSDVKDGMDISLLIINHITKKIHWSGANNPLWYIENISPSRGGQGEVATGEVALKEIKANKQPIGKTDNPKPFTTHEITVESGTFYLFTDGYADQFGGPHGKKFKYKQFEQLLLANCKLPMEEQKQILDKEFDAWKNNLEQVDDVCVIGIKIH